VIVYNNSLISTAFPLNDHPTSRPEVVALSVVVPADPVLHAVNRNPSNRQRGGVNKDLTGTSSISEFVGRKRILDRMIQVDEGPEERISEVTVWTRSCTYGNLNWYIYYQVRKGIEAAPLSEVIFLSWPQRALVGYIASQMGEIRLSRPVTGSRFDRARCQLILYQDDIISLILGVG
jgi:hypothetical protein